MWEWIIIHNCYKKMLLELSKIFYHIKILFCYFNHRLVQSDAEIPLLLYDKCHNHVECPR